MPEPHLTPEGVLVEAMLQISGMVKPMHEFAAGQVAYFRSQGHTHQEALAMTAAEFVTVFGSAIPRELPQ